MKSKVLNNFEIKKWIPVDGQENTYIPFLDNPEIFESKIFIRDLIVNEKQSFLFPVHKPKGITSFHAIAKFKRKFNIPNKTKIGHSGTLDPLAEGLLIIGCNPLGTRSLSNLLGSNKTYQFTMQCGATTPSMDEDTLDKINSCNQYKYFFDKNCKSIQQVNDFLNNYLKEKNYILEQEVPLYSALRVDGKRLYNYAHGIIKKNDDLILPKRNITIHELKCIDLNNEKGQLTFVCTCSKGTYIRSLALDIGYLLDCCGAFVTHLNRLKIGEFENGIDMDRMAIKE